MSLTLEIVEGPDAGQALELTRPVLIGRDAGVDLPLDDGQASRHHARVTPAPAGAVVEDLGSTNGTFVNHEEVHGPTQLAPGDELVVGVTVMELRSAGEVARQPSAVRNVPPPLAAMERRPSYVDPVLPSGKDDSGIPQLERLRDSRTKHKARVAPLAILVLALLVVVLYVGMAL